MGRALSIAGALLALALPATAHAHPTQLRDAMIGYGEQIADTNNWTLADLSWDSPDDSHALGTLYFVIADGEDWLFEFNMQITADRCMGGGIVTATAFHDNPCPGRMWREHVRRPPTQGRAGRKGSRRLAKRTTLPSSWRTQRKSFGP